MLAFVPCHNAVAPDASRVRLEPRELANTHVAHLCLWLNYSEL